jgi:hypothetical protein
VFQFPFGLTDELGADLLTVTGTPSTAGPARPKAPPTHRARPANLTVGTPTQPGMGIAVPQLGLHVRRYTRAGTPILAQTAPAGYGPATIGSYLGLSGDGAGQTVAVADAYKDPRIVSDVNTFSAQFGLPKICGTAGARSP